MGGLSLLDTLTLCELLYADAARYERAALRWLQRFIDERLPPMTEVALAASGSRSFGIDLVELARAPCVFVVSTAGHVRPQARRR